MDNAKQKFEKVLQIVADDMATVRTGRAKPDLVSGVDVMAYGSRMKLFELASVTAPDPSMIVIVPWDKSLLKDIEKAIMVSDLQLTPTVTSDQIRIIIPALTEERRRDFVKLLHQKLESGKVMVRQVRQELKEGIDKAQESGGVSEDQTKRDLESLQKMTDDYNAKLVSLAARKEEEIMAL